MRKYALVVVGYNRVNSIQRLLDSLGKAYYINEEVPLIISIDNSGTNEVEECAKAYFWPHGEKKIVTYSERQGLRKHILNCGNLLKEYDAIAVFEDDIVAAPDFYQYMKCCVEKYENEEQIAGISLYNHLWNVNVNMPFEPAFSGYDVYFMQYAQSWGQVWMKKQWFSFIEWYNDHSDEFGAQEDIPAFVSSWPKTSWLKYHIKYCIEKNKFFVYPYRALSTCFSEAGEHCKRKETHWQVPMLYGIKTNYCLPDIWAHDAIKYDAFFERVLSGESVAIKTDDFCMDIYGSRLSYLEKRYIFSSKQLPYKILKSYAMELKPHEMNVIYGISGKDIFLYDSNTKSKNDVYENRISRFLYYFRLYGNTKLILKYIFEKVKMKIVTRDK